MAGPARSIVIVVGMHRSGTSLCSHLLTQLGYDMGTGLDVHSSNAKGHWERPELVALHDRILRLFDRDYYSANHAFSLPAGWWTHPDVRKVGAEVVTWLRERMGQQFNFGFKDPRTCLLLPLWKEICAELSLEPKYVLCVREPAQIVRSIADRDKFEPSDTEYRWVRYNAHAIAGIGDADAAFIPYETWFTEPAANLKRLISALGSHWSSDDPTLVEAVMDIIAPELRHDADSQELLRPFTHHLYRLLMESGPANRPSEALLNAARNFVGIEQLHAYKQDAASKLARDLDAQKAAVEGLQKVETDLKAELATAKAALDQDKAALAAARHEIQQLRPPPPAEATPSLSSVESHEPTANAAE